MSLSQEPSSAPPELSQAVLGQRDAIVALASSIHWRSLVQRTFGEASGQQNLFRLSWALQWDDLVSQVGKASNALLLVEIEPTRLEECCLQVARFQARDACGSHCLIGLGDGLDGAQRMALSNAGFAATLDLLAAGSRLQSIAAQHFEASPRVQPTLEALVWQNLPWANARLR